jgi:hypothetical protein
MISSAGREAAKASGIDIISSVGTGVFDYGGATFNYETKQLIDADKVVEDCDRQFTRYPFCVVMLHPQDYTDTRGELLEDVYSDYYLALLAKLKEKNVSFATFAEIQQLFPRY